MDQFDRIAYAFPVVCKGRSASFKHAALSGLGGIRRRWATTRRGMLDLLKGIMS
jgi:hypothetical protein